jgi:hypothetical protein
MNAQGGAPNIKTEEGMEYVYSPLLGYLKSHTDTICVEAKKEIKEGNNKGTERVQTLLGLGNLYINIGNPLSMVQGEYLIEEGITILEENPLLCHNEGIKRELKSSTKIIELQNKIRINEYQMTLTCLYNEFKQGVKESYINWDLCSQGLKILSSNLSIKKEVEQWEILKRLAQKEGDTQTYNFLNGMLIESLIALNPEVTGSASLQKRAKKLLDIPPS